MQAALKALTFASTLGLASVVMAANCPGPDTFGHVCTTLTSGTCVRAAPANLITGVGDDTCHVRPLGFTYRHYGNPFTQVGVNSNGYIQMGGCGVGAGDFTNDCPIPNALTPNDSIYPYWDDLFPPGGGTLRDGTTGVAGSMVYSVEHLNVPYFSGTGTASFQAHLYENGTTGNQVDVCIIASGQQAYTTGLENATATDAIMLAPCNAGAPATSFTRYSRAATPTPTPGGGTCDLTPVLNQLAIITTTLNTINTTLGVINTNIGRLETKADANATAVGRLETKGDTNATAVGRLETKLDSNAGLADLPCQIYRMLSPRLPGTPDAVGSRCLGLAPTTCPNNLNCVEVP